MIYDIKDFLKRFFKSRLFVLATVITLMFATILLRVFTLQVINGQKYQDNFEMLIERTLDIDATRGNIYDCNGKLLAYNELAYSVTIADIGKYSKLAQKNKILNPQLEAVLTMLEENGETVVTNNFHIDLDEDGNYSFNVSGTKLKRFLADVFGRISPKDLKYNEELKFNEATATADQVMEYLINTYEIPKEYSTKIKYEIVLIRYAMKATTFSRATEITIAENVCDKTVAYINEHKNEMIGMDIEETTIRKYNDSVYFASIIGYTGKISEAEYQELSEKDKSYNQDDTIGKAGLEQFYESYLRGANGEQVVYVDNVGRISKVVSATEPVAGNDLYLSMDSDLQKTVYQLLEQEIAGIVYSNIKKGDIPIKDVYFALLDNNVIDITQFDDEDASAVEQAVYTSFLEEQKKAIDALRLEFYTENPKINNDMSEELLDYFTYIFTLLKNEEILDTSKIDGNDATYQKWRSGDLSPQEYLYYCIDKQWVDISILDVDSKYADTTEIYEAICEEVLEIAANDKEFSKYVYKYMVTRGEVTGKQLCLLLFDQGIIDFNNDTYAKIEAGSLKPFDFLLEKINYLEITPAQLALDPCTGSCVITDVKTGQVKAMVSYPGYDNNKLANGVDAEYFARLNDDNSNPQWNYATQEKTAPGSTFKMVTATAGLAEGLITPDTVIDCTGQFFKVDNEPRCWIYLNSRRTHQTETLAEAIKDSCNLYFYETGFRLSAKNTGTYSDANGIAYIKEYASIFGLDKKTGLEIVESNSTIATEYPVMAAIGQSNHNITTAALSRYITAVATGKLYEYKLMSRIVDGNGNVLEDYTPKYEDISSTLSEADWTSIRYGMNQVCENKAIFKDFGIKVAGKTGTAQQVQDRPNHALFVGFAPYEDPQISIATRIAYGYTSSNTTAVAKNIMSVYFGQQTLEEILALNAEGVNGSADNDISD